MAAAGLGDMSEPPRVVPWQELMKVSGGIEVHMGPDGNITNTNTGVYGDVNNTTIIQPLNPGGFFGTSFAERLRTVNAGMKPK
jgi:hypothetical protein